MLALCLAMPLLLIIFDITAQRYIDAFALTMRR